MIVNLLSTDDYVSFNSKLAQIVGLHSAIYISELINISNKASRKNKLVEGTYFRINRVYIKERTTLENKEQREIDKNLSKIGIVKISKTDPDLISIDLKAMVSLLSDEDESTLDKIAQYTKLKDLGTKLTPREAQCQLMKRSVVCSNEELLKSYYGWIESVYANPKGFLSQAAVQINQRAVDDFTKGNLDIALEVLDIATVNGYRDINWAINDWKKKNPNKFSPPTPTNHSVGRPKLSDEVF